MFCKLLYMSRLLFVQHFSWESSFEYLHKDINFIMFLPGKLRQNVRKRNFVRRPQCIGTLLCAPVHETLALCATFLMRIILLSTRVRIHISLCFFQDNYLKMSLKETLCVDRNVLVLFCMPLYIICFHYVYIYIFFYKNQALEYLHNVYEFR